MSDIMRPMTFDHLMNWALEEYAKQGSIFGVADPVKHTDGQALPVFEEKINSWTLEQSKKLWGELNHRV